MAPFKLRLRMGGSRSSSHEHDSDRVNEALIPNNQSAKIRASSSTIDSSIDCSLGSLGTNECKSLLPNNSTMDYISWNSLQDIGNGGSLNSSAAALTTPPQLYDYELELEEVGKKLEPSTHSTNEHSSSSHTQLESVGGCGSGTGAGAGGSGGGDGNGGAGSCNCSANDYRYNDDDDSDSQNDGASLELQTLQCNMSNEFIENELQQISSSNNNHNHNNTNTNNNNNDNYNDIGGNAEDDGDDDDDDNNDDDEDDDDDVSNERSDRAGRSSSKETIDVAAAQATTPTSQTEQLLEDCHCTEYSEELSASGDECKCDDDNERCSSDCSCNRACGESEAMMAAYGHNYMDGSHYGNEQMIIDSDDGWGTQQHSEQYGQNESCLTQEILSHKSSKEIYKDLAKQWGITCKMSDGCRCMECQSHYFDCEFDDNDHQKTDGGLGAGTPMFLSEVMHGSACNIL